MSTSSNTDIGEPKDETNIPKILNFQSILAANQVCLEHLINKKTSKDEDMKIIIRRKEAGGLDENIRKFGDRIYEVYDKLPMLFSKNYLEPKPLKDNYFIYFMDNEDFINGKNLLQMYESGENIENLKDFCNKYENAKSDFFNILSTSFLQLIGNERYKSFNLDRNFENQIMIVETDLLFKFTKLFKETELEDYGIGNITKIDEKIPVRLVLCGYKETTEDVYLKLFNMIYKYNNTYHKTSEVKIRMMPNNINYLENILVNYLEYQYYQDIKLFIYHTNFDSNLKTNITNILNLNDSGQDNNKTEKISSIINRISNKIKEFKNRNTAPLMMTCKKVDNTEEAVTPEATAEIRTGTNEPVIRPSAPSPEVTNLPEQQDEQKIILASALQM